MTISLSIEMPVLATSLVPSGIAGDACVTARPGVGLTGERDATQTPRHVGLSDRLSPDNRSGDA